MTVKIDEKDMEFTARDFGTHSMALGMLLMDVDSLNDLDDDDFETLLRLIKIYYLMAETMIDKDKLDPDDVYTNTLTKQNDNGRDN